LVDASDLYKRVNPEATGQLCRTQARQDQAMTVCEYNHTSNERLFESFKSLVLHGIEHVRKTPSQSPSKIKVAVIVLRKENGLYTPYMIFGTCNLKKNGTFSTTVDLDECGWYECDNDYSIACSTTMKKNDSKTLRSGLVTIGNSIVYAASQFFKAHQDVRMTVNTKRMIIFLAHATNTQQKE